MENQSDKPKRAFYKRWWFWVAAVVVLLIALSIGGGDEESKQVNQPQQDNFATLAQQRFNGIKELAPELDSIECEGSCRDVAYFRLNKIPDDLDFFIRGNTATFANFDLENGGDGNVAIITTYQDKVVKKCYGEKGANGKGFVKSCE